MRVFVPEVHRNEEVAMETAGMHLLCGCGACGGSAGGVQRAPPNNSLASRFLTRCTPCALPYPQGPDPRPATPARCCPSP